MAELTIQQTIIEIIRQAIPTILPYNERSTTPSFWYLGFLVDLFDGHAFLNTGLPYNDRQFDYCDLNFPDNLINCLKLKRIT